MKPKTMDCHLSLVVADFPKQYELPRRRPLVDNIVKRGELMALFAASKMGKSWFFQNMATCLAEGLPFLDCETVKSNVLVMDLELTKVDAMDRLWNIALAMGLKHPPKNLHLWSLKKHCYDLDLLTEILHSRLVKPQIHSMQFSWIRSIFSMFQKGLMRIMLVALLS